MTAYRIKDGVNGLRYERRTGSGEWEGVSDDEAKAVGVWRDARRSTIGVRDDLATPEQIAARDKGLYDPRGPSGNRIAKRLSLRCGSCDAELGAVVDFERRTLYYSTRTGRWTMGPAGLKCHHCYGPLEPFGVDLKAIERELQRAREHGGNKPRALRVGMLPEKVSRHASHDDTE